MKIIQKEIVVSIALLCLFCLAASKASAALIAKPQPGKILLATKAGGPGKRTLTATTPLGRLRGLLVLKQRQLDGVNWLALRTPWRPNRRAMWAPEDSFFLRYTPWRLVVDLSRRKMSFYYQGKLSWSTPVIVGKEQTPTPTGLFALHDFYRASGDLRPFVFQTTAHSRVLRTWYGGEARVALHGRHGSLMAPWGTAASNGCIRTPDWALRKIKRRVTLGMPIRIQR